MAKGTIAKEYVVKKIKEVFAEDFIGEQDKKVYVWGIENGEKIQIAISLTCTKNPIGGINFEMMPVENEVRAEVVETAEITQVEKDNVAELIKMLGI